MKDFADRFLRMVEELRRDDRLVVLASHLGPPATEAEIASVEARAGFVLDDSVRSLYREANGAQLSWISRANGSFDPDRHRSGTGPFDVFHPWHDDQPEDGVINILPLEKVFLGDFQDIVCAGDEDGDEDFDGRTFDRRSLRNAIRPFDAFSNYRNIALFTGDAGTQVPVRADDYWACIDATGLAGLGSYVEFLLAFRGRVASRQLLVRRIVDGAEQETAYPVPVELWTSLANTDVLAPDLRDVVERALAERGAL